MAHKLEKLTLNRFINGINKNKKQTLLETSELYESFIEVAGLARNYKVVRSNWFIQRPVERVEQKLAFDIYAIHRKELYPVTMGRNLQSYAEVLEVLNKIDKLCLHEITE